MKSFELVSNWILVLRTCNLPKERRLDLVSKWLIISRACVFSMTLISALIGGLLAAVDSYFHWLYFILVILGLILAHAANNMVNDYFDYLYGVDTPDYPRASYSPHPILSGLTSQGILILVIFVCLLIDLLIAIYLTSVRGLSIMGFAVVGLVVSLSYVAWPLKLKRRGLGELAIFLIWGPLMIGGTYFTLTAKLSLGVFLASVPYGLAVTSVLMGKHLDKVKKDRIKGIKTLPVILGERRSRLLTQIMVVSFYLLIVALATQGVLPILSLAVLLSLPQAIRFISILSAPLPATPKEAFEVAKEVVPKDLKAKFDPDMPEEEIPLWPLWYVAWGVWWTRVAGGLFVLSLILQVILQEIF